jgi:hypothetical protein
MFCLNFARVAKWQTHYLEVVAPERVWRFNSSPAHQNPDNLFPKRFSVLSKRAMNSLRKVFAGVGKPSFGANKGKPRFCENNLLVGIFFGRLFTQNRPALQVSSRRSDTFRSGTVFSHVVRETRTCDFLILLRDIFSNAILVENQKTRPSWFLSTCSDLPPLMLL